MCDCIYMRIVVAFIDDISYHSTCQKYGNQLWHMSLNTWETAMGNIIRLEIGPIFGGIEIGHKESSNVFWEKILFKDIFKMLKCKHRRIIVIAAVQSIF